MTVKDFENYLVHSRANLMSEFQKVEDIKDLDVYIKTVLDYQEIIAKQLFKEFVNINNNVDTIKRKILEDNRERFNVIMETLKKYE